LLYENTQERGLIYYTVGVVRKVLKKIMKVKISSSELSVLDIL